MAFKSKESKTKLARLEFRVTQGVYPNKDSVDDRYCEWSRKKRLIRIRNQSVYIPEDLRATWRRKS